MRIFGSDRISGLMQRLGMEEGVPIEHRMVTKAIERAQKQVESNNFSIRKHLLEYDDVMNKQRENVYGLRRELLEGQIHVAEDETVDVRGYLMVLGEELAEGTVTRYADEQSDPEEWDLDALKTAVAEIFAFEPQELAQLDFSEKTAEEIADAVWGLAVQKYEAKEKLIDDASILHRVERDIMLQIVDAQWKDHLYSLDHLKEGIGLRGYGQRDPLVEYKKESFELFQAMRDRIDEEIVRYLWRLMPVPQEATGSRNGLSARAPAGAPQAEPDDAQRPVHRSVVVPVRRDPRQQQRRRRRGGRRRTAATGPARRRRRGAPGPARRAEGRAQRPVPVREREEIQEVPRSLNREWTHGQTC